MLLTTMQWRPVLKPALGSYALWGGIVAALVCALCVADFYFWRVAQRVIVTATETSARQAPLEESQIAFTLHDGAELAVIDQKDQWLQVRVDSPISPAALSVTTAVSGASR